jgi:hypothetical protein
MISDGEAMAQDVISVQVTSDYVPKLTKSLPDVWLYEGTTKENVFDLDDYFTDPDNDAIYFSYGQSHIEIMIHEDHTVDFTAASEWTGNELVTFRARDPMGALAEDSLVVTVLPVNDPPSISGVPDFYIRYDNDYRFDLTPYIFDSDNSTDELRIIPSDTEHIRLDVRNNMVIILNYPEEFLDQKVPIRLTVFDGLDSSFQDVSVTITEDFPPELLSPIPDIVFLEDQPLRNAFDLDNYFLDIDGDVLYYTTGNDNIEITINFDHTVDLAAPQHWYGNELVYFRATDPTGALQQDIVLMTVLPVNDPPYLEDIPPQYGNESERWILDLEEYITDVDNNISEIEITVDNEFVVVTGSSLIFLGSPDLGKEIEVTISDGEFSRSQIIDIHLRFAKPIKSPTMWDLLINILPILIIIILIILAIAAVVYRKKSRFTAEEVFLIHQGGTLITHLSRQPQANVDDIIFSGMFTAVQEFINDTFTSDSADAADDNKWALDELKLGDNNILIERSENTYLAVIFSGEGSKRLRRIVIKLLNKIESKYDYILPRWDGNITELKGTKNILSVLIKPFDEPETELKEEKPVKTETSVLKTESKQISEPDLEAGTSLFSLLQGSSDENKDEPIKQTVSTPIKVANVVRHPKKTSKGKELLKLVSKQTGAGRPGLPAFPLRKKRSSKGVISSQNRYPIALTMNTTKTQPKTVVIEKGQIRIDGKIAKPVGATGSKSSLMAKPVSSISPAQKKSEFDPSRSLFQQFAERNK